MLIARVLACAGLLAGLSAPAALAQGTVRPEGGSARRALVDPMQLAPFDQGLWANLSKWEGTPVTAESAKDKVVLIVTFTGYHKSAAQALAVAQTAQAKHAGKGLVVVGVHNPQGFDSAPAVVKEKGVTFAYAADEGGKFRQALKVDQDPDFYLIDRAGNMRYADIETASVDAAVTELVNETPEKAAGVPAARKDAALKAETERWRTGEVKGLLPWQTPVVEYTPPSEDAYAKARWPKNNSKTGIQSHDDLAKKIEKGENPTYALPDEGWVPAKPVTAGKVVVMYCFNVKLGETLNAIPVANRLQDQYPRDAVFVAQWANTTAENQNTGTPAEEEKKNKDRERMVKGLVRDRHINHPVNGTVYKGDDGSGNSNLGTIIQSVEEISYALIVSTDGKVRFIGNPHYDNFKAALETTIRNDPGVQARRKAEEAAGMEP